MTVVWIGVIATVGALAWAVALYVRDRRAAK